MVAFRNLLNLAVPFPLQVQILDHHKTAYGAFNVLEDASVREGIKQYSYPPTS